MTRRKTLYRWVTPEGVRGPWRKRIDAVVCIAVAKAFSDAACGVKVTFNARAAASLWPDAQEKGWSLEKVQIP